MKAGGELRGIGGLPPRAKGVGQVYTRPTKAGREIESGLFIGTDQHLIDLRLTPCRSLAMAFLMASLADGTLHAVSPTSTFTTPIFSATAWACAASGFT